ncbi:MAG: response regulator transcription factor [Actinomycetota bacterium]
MSLRGRTLVVDDQEDIRLLLKMTIDAANHGLLVCGEAEDGPGALAIIEDLDPDVVVLDQMMPGMSGVQTAAAIRARRPSQKMIMCSAYLDEDVIATATAAGILACVAKDQWLDVPAMLLAIAAD